MTYFRPCIDLHNGKVKQIVGGSLKDQGPGPQTNFVSDKGAEWYASLYRADELKGGHIIKLGPGNDSAALEALKAYPGGMQIGGGINLENAHEYLKAGASQVIVTSWIFREGKLDWDRVKKLSDAIGRDKLVLDLSCRRDSSGWKVATDRWQTITETPIDRNILERLAQFCCEFLIHAADVEGKQAGMDLELIEFLGENSPIPCTYAGGASSLKDLKLVDQLSKGRVDLTIGSALDIFGGKGVRYKDCVEWNHG